MDILAMIQAVPGVGPFLPYVLMVFGICAVVAAQLPPPTQQDSLYGVVYRVVNLLAHNYNHARNASAPSAPAAPPSATAAAVLLALALASSVTACAGAGSNPAGDIAALEASLTAAETVATGYVRLPACTGSNGPLCADPAIVARIKAADAEAYALVKSAEGAVDDPGALTAAQAAVTTLTTLTSTLPKQGS